jgi:hypothetical protein
VVALAGLLLAESLADARRGRRRHRRRSRSDWVIKPGTATHALKPLEAIGMDRKRVRRVTGRLAKQIEKVPGVQLAPLKRIRRFLRSRDGAPYATCEGELKCVTRFGKLIRAPRVVAGDLSGLANGYVLFLRLVDPRKDKVLRKVSVVYGGEQGKEKPVLREAAYRLLAPDRFVGELALDIDVKGATVYLNGKPLGKSPLPPQQVQAGTHALRITHPSYHDFLRFVRVNFEKRTEVKASLKMYPIIAEEMKAKGSKARHKPPVDPKRRVDYRPLPWYKRWWFITSVGVVVLAATVTTVALVRKRHLERDASVTLSRPARAAPVLFRFP